LTSFIAAQPVVCKPLVYDTVQHFPQKVKGVYWYILHGTNKKTQKIMQKVKTNRYSSKDTVHVKVRGVCPEGGREYRVGRISEALFSVSHEA